MKEYKRIEGYLIKVEGKMYFAPFSYCGMMSCMIFIKKYGDVKKRYTLKYMKIKNNIC